MSLDKRITSAVTNTMINHFRQSAREKLQELRMNLDLDQDGRSDIDQAVELVERLAEGLKKLAQAIDFEKVGSGLDKLVAGLSETGAAINVPDARGSLTVCKDSSTELLKLVGLALANYKSTHTDNSP